MLGREELCGSDITFEFGRPRLEIREPPEASPKVSKRVRELFARRRVHVHGEWHLWIWICGWEIFQNTKRVGSHRSTSNLDRVVFSLNGQKLVRFSMSNRGNDCHFEFDLGGVLVTHRSPVRADAEADHWQLFEPSGYVLTLRNDGTFSCQRSNRPAGLGSEPVSRSARLRETVADHAPLHGGSLRSVVTYSQRWAATGRCATGLRGWSGHRCARGEDRDRATKAKGQYEVDRPLAQ